MERQQALEMFLNDAVKKISVGLYVWHGRYYEILPRSTTIRRHNWSGFIRLDYKGKTWMLREASEDIIKEYYPKVHAALDLYRAIKLNPKLIVDR